MFDVGKLYDEARQRLFLRNVDPDSIAMGYLRLIAAMDIVQRCGGLDAWDKMTECEKRTATLFVFENIFWYEGSEDRLNDETEKTVDFLRSRDPEQWTRLSVVERAKMCISHMHDFLENSKKYGPRFIDADNFIDVFYREVDFIYDKQADENYNEVEKDFQRFDEMMKYWDFSMLYEWFEKIRHISFTDYDKAAFWRASEAVCETCKSQIKGLKY